MSDKPQMRHGNNLKVMPEQWHFWADDKPDDVDGNPNYFDKVAHVPIDLQLGDPLSSIGVTFKVFLGNPMKQFHWAEFMVCGVQRTVAETGVSTYRLMWKRITAWDFISVEQMRGIRREVHWNVAKRVHEVRENGVVVYSSPDKEDAQRVAGMGPVPAQAA